MIIMQGTSGGFPITDPNALPGFHLCWVRVPTSLVKDSNNIRAFTGNQYGYSVVRPEELPGIAYDETTHAGIEGGCIVYQDTVLCKVPNKRYAAIRAGEDYKAQTQAAKVKSLHNDGAPQNRKVKLHLDRNNRPFPITGGRVVDLSE
jgi:hypothetical protein